MTNLEEKWVEEFMDEFVGCEMNGLIMRDAIEFIKSLLLSQKNEIIKRIEDRIKLLANTDDVNKIYFPGIPMMAKIAVRELLDLLRSLS